MEETYVESGSIGIEPVLPTREELKKRPVKGWFSFLLFSVSLGGLVSIVAAFVGVDGESMAISPLLGSLDIQIGAILLGVAIYSVSRVWGRQADAIFWLRFYLVLCFLSAVISVWSNDGLDGFTRYERKSVVRGLVWSVVWFIYLSRSIHVGDVFPKAYRKASAGAKVAAAFLLALPFISFGLGFSAVQLRAANWNKAEYFLEDMREGELTEGHVRFPLPDGAAYQILDAENCKVAVITREGAYFGCVFSAPYFGEDESNFEDIRLSNRDEAFEGAVETPQDTRTDVFYGRNVRIKTTRLEKDGAACSWRFAAIYDRKSRKTAFLSFYDRMEVNEDFERMMRSVDF